MEPEEVRELFPIFKKRHYIFSGGTAPSNTRALESVQAHLHRLTYDADDYYYHARDDLIEVKELFSKLMCCNVEEVAVTEGTSAASNIAVDLIHPTPGSNVVFDEFTYPSSIYPWLLPPRDQVEVRFVKQRDGIIHLEDVQNAVDDRTIAVSVCHVSPFEGFRHDIAKLAEIAHSHGAVLLVDGAQGAGAIDLDLHSSGVDFYSCCAMKWLLGASGLGFLYVAAKHLDKTPSRAGYVAGGRDVKNFELVPSASRFELGMPSLMSLAYTKPGLEILLETGMDIVESHILDLSGRIISGLKKRGLNVVTPEDSRCRLGIIAIHMEDAHGLFQTLYDRGVDTYAAPLTLPYYRGGFVQIGPHIYNNLEDIERLFGAVDAYNSR